MNWRDASPGTCRALLLLDGDGLTALASHPDILRARPGETVLTPHPGEMSRITGISVPDLLEDPVPNPSGDRRRPGGR